jgi:starch phosphorylase
MVEGCDVWLNNPRRPLEASGTSGMKVIANAGLNFSILDGWWDEGFDSEVGWKIGDGEEFTDPDYQDEVESRQLYHILESQITPLFYQRGEDQLPRAWITKVKNSMKKLGPVFNTHRMVQEYFEKYYKASYERRLILKEDNWKKAVKLAAWKEKVTDNWTKLKISHVQTSEHSAQIFVGQEFSVTAEIELGELSADDVEVQIYYGPIEKQDEPHYNSTVVMSPVSSSEKGIYKYCGTVLCRQSGQQGYTIRILPKNELLIHPFELGVVYWAV